MSLPNPITHRSIDQVEQSLMKRYREISSNEYHALVDLREYDLRQGWKAWHLNNCAEWLNFKCGISKGAAWERVRVARALMDLPHCSRAMEEGRLTFCHVRALTRIATPLNEKALVEYAEQRPVSQVEEYCRQRRNALRGESTADVNRMHRQRYLSCVHHDDGSSTIQADLTREKAELVMKAIERVMGADPSEGNLDEDDSFFARQADALVDMARTCLDGGNGKAGSTADRYQVMVHVDEAVLHGGLGKSDLPVESLKRILCDSAMVPVIEDDKGNPLNVGRKHRIVPPALRRALHARDKQCRYPGCTHSRWLEPHHIVHWADGGESSLDNTMLLCSKHHRLHHEGGYLILTDYRGRVYFKTVTGKTIPEAPMYKPEKYDADRDLVIDADSSRDECEKTEYEDSSRDESWGGDRVREIAGSYAA